MIDALCASSTEPHRRNLGCASSLASLTTVSLRLLDRHFVRVQKGEGQAGRMTLTLLSSFPSPKGPEAGQRRAEQRQETRPARRE